jgi:hypothetical protein
MKSIVSLVMNKYESQLSKYKAKFSKENMIVITLDIRSPVRKY